MRPSKLPWLFNSATIDMLAADIHLIFACANDGVIGLDNKLPWHLPEDLAHFKKITTGQTVLMGRHTWDSLPNAFKPLPNRLNLVMTKQIQWSAPGAVAVHSLEMAQELHQAHWSKIDPETHSLTPSIWVIGGAQIYAHTLSLAHTIEMTQIDLDVKGDAFAPALGQEWREIHREEHTSSKGVRFRFLTLKRF
jgi:dihydrofolate reductase